MNLVKILLIAFALQSCAASSQIKLSGVDGSISLINGVEKEEAYNSASYVVKNIAELQRTFSALNQVTVNEIYSISKSLKNGRYSCSVWVNFRNGYGSISICLTELSGGEYEAVNVIESSH